MGTLAVPTFLSSKLFIDLSTKDVFESGMDELLRDLLNAPLYIKPPIGNDPFKVSVDPAVPVAPNPLQRFMRAMNSVYESAGADGLMETDIVKIAMNSSNLLFSHAMDRAIALEYIQSPPTGNYFWVTAKGRDQLISLS
jgi:hypothetical protein